MRGCPLRCVRLPPSPPAELAGEAEERAEAKAVAKKKKAPPALVGDLTEMLAALKRQPDASVPAAAAKGSVGVAAAATKAVESKVASRVAPKRTKGSAARAALLKASSQLHSGILSVSGA